MFQDHQAYWIGRPTTLFEETLYENDQLFYATFPDGRDAASQQNPYDYADFSSLHDGVQSLVYDIRNSDISPSGGTDRPVSYSMLYFDYSQKPPTYYYPPPVEHDATVYILPDPHYYHQYSSEPTTSHSPQSSSSSFFPREPTPFLINQRYNESSPHVNTHLEKTPTDDDHRPPENLNPDFGQLNRQMKPPILTTTPTEFLLKSPTSPSIGLSSLPPKKSVPEKKPSPACFFCRGRKIECGPPLPGRKTCNQCRKRSLQCHYPSESRRGKRKKKNDDGSMKLVI